VLAILDRNGNVLNVGDAITVTSRKVSVSSVSVSP
jgi:hypothetical protein